MPICSFAFLCISVLPLPSLLHLLHYGCRYPWFSCNFFLLSMPHFLQQFSLLPLLNSPICCSLSETLYFFFNIFSKQFYLGYQTVQLPLFLLSPPWYFFQLKLQPHSHYVVVRVYICTWVTP